MEQEIHYEILVTFPGKDAPPTVKPKLLDNPKVHKPCAKLKDLLRALDKKAPAKDGKLLDAYNHPRPHTVEVPR